MSNANTIILIVFVILSLGGIAIVLDWWNTERKRALLNLGPKQQRIYTFGSMSDGTSMIGCPQGKRIRVVSTSVSLPNGQACDNETTSRLYPTTQHKSNIDAANNGVINANNWLQIITDPCPSKSTKMIHGSYVCEKFFLIDDD